MEEINNITTSKHVNESTGLIYEFYARANINPAQNKVTKDMEIWIYGHDRENMTPHCHLMNNDIEIAVSLIDWSIVNVKRPKGLSPDWSNFTDFHKRFIKWLNLPNEEGNPNYYSLFGLWNHENEDAMISDFVEKHGDLTISEDLKSFLESRKKYLQNIYRQVTGELFARFYTNEKQFPFKQYSPLELIKMLEIPIAIDEEDEEALEAITNAEDFVYRTVY